MITLITSIITVVVVVLIVVVIVSVVVNEVRKDRAFYASMQKKMADEAQRDEEYMKRKD